MAYDLYHKLKLLTAIKTKQIQESLQTILTHLLLELQPRRTPSSIRYVMLSGRYYVLTLRINGCYFEHPATTLPSLLRFVPIYWMRCSVINIL